MAVGVLVKQACGSTALSLQVSTSVAIMARASPSWNAKAAVISSIGWDIECHGRRR